VYFVNRLRHHEEDTTIQFFIGITFKYWVGVDKLQFRCNDAKARKEISFNAPCRQAPSNWCNASLKNESFIIKLAKKDTHSAA
jgi:hypothetical protein